MECRTMKRILCLIVALSIGVFSFVAAPGGVEASVPMIDMSSMGHSDCEGRHGEMPAKDVGHCCIGSIAVTVSLPLNSIDAVSDPKPLPIEYFDRCAGAGPIFGIFRPPST